MANIITSLFKKSVDALNSKQEKDEDENPLFESLLTQLIDEAKAMDVYYEFKLSDHESGKQIMAMDKEQSLQILMYVFPQYVDMCIKRKSYWSDGSFRSLAMKGIISGMLKRKLPFDIMLLNVLLTQLLRDKNLNSYNYPLSSIFRAIEQFKDHNQFTEELSEVLLSLSKRLLGSGHAEADNRRFAARAKRLVQPVSETKIPLTAGEAWTNQAIQGLSALSHDFLLQWIDLLVHCQSSKPARPSKKWLKEAQQKIDGIGYSNFQLNCLQWLQLLSKPKTVELKQQSQWQPDPNLLLIEENADVLKGLIWCCSIVENADLARQLTKTAIYLFKKIPGYGAISTRVGNAVIYTLASMPGKTGLYQLSVLKIKIKYRQALALMDKSLRTAAQREGLTIDELDEMGIPGFGLDKFGYGEETLGEYAAIIQIAGFHAVELNWRKADKIQKSVPANVKEHYSQELKDIKGNIKDIKSMLSVQKDRLEGLFLKELQWTFDVWQERYLNHPVVGVFAQKLIWCFAFGSSRELALMNDGRLETVDGNDISLDVHEAKVSLWHPITSSVAQIKAWRNRLQLLQLTQPFKQAHREVYLLTDAEKNTDVYSNRYASHIIKQHQFNALAAVRGWKFSLQGCWDGGDEMATIRLPKFNISAEFWVNGIGEYGQDTTESGVFLYASTDQVRFYNLMPDLDDLNEDNINSQRPMPLADVPTLVLSEIFRDVDLYVGVCSVGNDPEWSDGGRQGAYRDYWHSFSFGELSATAVTRKEILENLIPKLHFGSQCKFVERFLVVEGKKRIYKIHLGSGNILMEPNNQYLCIVPDGKKKKQDVFLPFEGDNTLSIILSKAMLLANDDKIKDSTINSQINTM